MRNYQSTGKHCLIVYLNHWTCCDYNSVILQGKTTQESRIAVIFQSVPYLFSPVVRMSVELHQPTLKGERYPRKVTLKRQSNQLLGFQVLHLFVNGLSAYSWILHVSSQRQEKYSLLTILEIHISHLDNYVIKMKKIAQKQHQLLDKGELQFTERY